MGHHGKYRKKSFSNLAKYDVDITTYAIVVWELINRVGTGYQTSYDDFSFKVSFFGVNWNRVILDEAHVTRIYRCKTSEASTFAFPRIFGS